MRCALVAQHQRRVSASPPPVRGCGEGNKRKTTSTSGPECTHPITGRVIENGLVVNAVDCPLIVASMRVTAPTVLMVSTQFPLFLNWNAGASLVTDDAA